MVDPVLLSESRREQLETLGLATFEGDKITYTKVGYSDNLADPEEQVRADFYLDLVTEYGYDGDDAIQMERLHKIGHPHKKTDAKIDIVVSDVDGAPFMIVELKSPTEYEEYLESSIRTQVFNVAAVENQTHQSIQYLVYHTRWWEGNTLREKTVCIDYVAFPSFDAWDQAGRPNLRVIPANYGRVRVPRYVKGGKVDLRVDVDREELARIRRDLHNILWGGGKYQNELFFNLVGLFLAKIYDEKETNVGDAYSFQVYFEEDAPELADKVYDRMNEMYFKALREYLGYTEEDLAKIKNIVFDPPKVRYVVEVLQGISFTTSRFDVIGDFFEGIVRGEFKQSKGQYLTHPTLIRFIVAGLDIPQLALSLINEEKRLPYVLDPACGSGAFLIEAMKSVTQFVLANLGRVRSAAAVQEFVKTSFPEFRRNAWARDYIFGIEINGDLAAASKVNMVGHGDGSANIEARDGLMPFNSFSSSRLRVTKESPSYPKPVNGQFDVVVSNPPFSVTVDRDTAKTFPESYVQGDAIARSLSSSSELEVATELLFVERFFQMLSPLGRLGVVLPESVFDASTTRSTRIFLFRYFRVLAIVSLPTEAFAPYTTTKTSIVFAEKRTDSGVKAWDAVWKKKSDEYKGLRRQLAHYVDPPQLVVKTAEIVKTFKEKSRLDIDDEVTDAVAEAVMFHARDHHKSPELLDEVQRIIVAQFDLPGEERNLLQDIVNRKRSLGAALAAFVERTESKDEFVGLLQRLFGRFFNEVDVSMTIEELVEEYGEELRYADHDWWVFRETAGEVDDHRIVLGLADEIGYKRGIRGEDNRPNELFRESEDGIIVDADDPQTVLEHMRANIVWSR